MKRSVVVDQCIGNKRAERFDAMQQMRAKRRKAGIVRFKCRTQETCSLFSILEHALISIISGDFCRWNKDKRNRLMSVSLGVSSGPSWHY